MAAWQRFETIRNRLPIVDHSLIADAEASHLRRSTAPPPSTSSWCGCCSCPPVKPPPGPGRRRLGPRTTMFGEKLEPVLPRLAALQHNGVLSTEKVAIVERAMHKLCRPDLDPEEIETAEELLTDHAAILGPSDLRRSPTPSSTPPTPTGRSRRRPTATRPAVSGVEATPRRHVASRRPTHQHRRCPTQRILDPLTTPRSSAIEDEDGTVLDIPDQRP